MRCSYVYPATPVCTRDAVWQVSVHRADPWPLQYACPGHLEDAIRQLGGDCRVTVLLEGMTLHPPRTYLGSIRMTADDRVPVGQVKVGNVTITNTDVCPSTYTYSSTPRTTVRCERDDDAAAHTDRLHMRHDGTRMPRWPVTADDLARWRT